MDRFRCAVGSFPLLIIGTTNILVYEDGKVEVDDSPRTLKFRILPRNKSEGAFEEYIFYREHMPCLLHDHRRQCTGTRMPLTLASRAALAATPAQLLGVSRPRRRLWIITTSYNLGP